MKCDLCRNQEKNSGAADFEFLAFELRPPRSVIPSGLRRRAKLSEARSRGTLCLLARDSGTNQPIFISPSCMPIHVQLRRYKTKPQGTQRNTGKAVPYAH